MKNLFILFFLLIAIMHTTAQDWQWQNPLPQGNSLNCVRFVDANTGYAVGDMGTIIKTIVSRLGKRSEAGKQLNGKAEQ